MLIPTFVTSRGIADDGDSSLILVNGITDGQSDKGENGARAFFSKRYPDSEITEFDFFDPSTEENLGVEFLWERAKALLDRLTGLTLLPLVFMGHDLGGSLIKKVEFPVE